MYLVIYALLYSASAKVTNNAAPLYVVGVVALMHMFVLFFHCPVSVRLFGWMCLTFRPQWITTFSMPLLFAAIS